MRSSRHTLLLVLSALSTVATLPAVGCHKQPAQTAPADLSVARLSPEQAAAAKLQVEPAAERQIGAGVRTTGRVVLRDLDTAHVFSPVTGRVVRIEAALGAYVMARAPLAVIASPDVGQAFADLEKANADSRPPAPSSSGSASCSRRRRRRARIGSGASGRRQGPRRAGARAAQGPAAARAAPTGEAQEYMLRAPIDGEVVARNVTPGVEVQGQYAGGTVVELFTIGELDTSGCGRRVRDGPRRASRRARRCIEVVCLSGRDVRRRGSTGSPARSTPRRGPRKVRCALANPDRELKPEMYATVTIAAGGTTRWPCRAAALLRLGDQTVVFVERERARRPACRFERRPVAVDEEGSGGVTCPSRAGSAAGDRVVTSGGILLSGMIRVTERLVRAAVNAPVVIIAASLVLLGGGVYAYHRLDIEAYPNPVPPMIEVITQPTAGAPRRSSATSPCRSRSALAGMPGSSTSARSRCSGCPT